MLLELAGSWSEDTAALFSCCPRWGEAEHLLDVLANGHCAQNVQEDEGTLVVVFAGKIAMAESLNPRDRLEGKASNDATVESEKYAINTHILSDRTFATYMLLNMPRRAVNAKPVVIMLFILTSDRSRLLFFSFSSSRSIFFLCCLSRESPWVSLRRSTMCNIRTRILKH